MKPSTNAVRKQPDNHVVVVNAHTRELEALEDEQLTMPGMGGPTSPTLDVAEIESTWNEREQRGSQTIFHGATVNNADPSIERLIHLLTNEDTAELHERQLAVLRRVCKVRQRG